MFKVISFKKKEQEHKSRITEILSNKALLLQDYFDNPINTECFISANLYDELLSENMGLTLYMIKTAPDARKSKVFQYSGVYYKLDMRMARDTADFVVSYKDCDGGLKQGVYTLVVVD